MATRLQRLLLTGIVVLVITLGSAGLILAEAPLVRAAHAETSAVGEPGVTDGYQLRDGSEALAPIPGLPD